MVLSIDKYKRYQNLLSYVNIYCDGKFSVLAQSYGRSSILNYVSLKFPPKSFISDKLARKIESRLNLNKGDLDSVCTFDSSIIPVNENSHLHHQRILNILKIIEIYELGSHKVFKTVTGINSISNYIGRHRIRNPGRSLCNKIEAAYSLDANSLDSELNWTELFKNTSSAKLNKIRDLLFDRLGILLEIYTLFSNAVDSNIQTILEQARECATNSDNVNNKFIHPLSGQNTKLPFIYDNGHYFVFGIKNINSCYRNLCNTAIEEINKIKLENGKIKISFFDIDIYSTRNCHLIDANFYKNINSHRKEISYSIDQLVMLRKEIRTYYNALSHIYIELANINKQLVEVPVIEHKDGFALLIFELEELVGKCLAIPAIKGIHYLNEIRNVITNGYSNDILHLMMLEQSYICSDRRPALVTKNSWLQSTISGDYL